MRYTIIQYVRTLGLALLLSVGFEAGGLAASFDCNKATTQTEKAICTDFELSVDDRVISYLFEKHMDWRKGRDVWWTGDGTSKTKREILRSQREWLNSSRNECSNSLACLKNSLDQRIDYLLDHVRLEAPLSGSKHQQNLAFKHQEKFVLRFIGGIIENMDKNNIFPALKSTEERPVISGEPVYLVSYGTQIVWDDSGKTRNDHILAENNDPSMQLAFGKYSSVDYEKLTKCLESHSIKTFRWLGDPVRLTTMARDQHGCISFVWKDQGENGVSLPNIQSRYIKIDTQKYMEINSKLMLPDEAKRKIFFDKNGYVKQIYVSDFLNFYTLSAYIVSNDILMSPDRKFVLTNMHRGCSATLFDIINKTSVINIEFENGRECYTYVGFSPNSQLWYVYGENSLDVSIYNLKGKLIGEYNVTNDPYINGVEFSKDNKKITVRFDKDRPSTVIDISGDLKRSK